MSEQNSITERLQMARLYEWIGKLEQSESIYKELRVIANSEYKGVAKLLITTIDEKLKEIDIKQNQSEEYFKKRINRVADTSVKPSKVEQHELLLNPEPKHEKLKGLHLNKLTLQYTVSQTAVWDEDVRLELRAFYPKRVVPNFLALDFQEIPLDIHLTKKNNLSSSYILEWTGNISIPLAQFHISMDKWGLIKGTVLGNSKDAGDLLLFIHHFLGVVETCF